MTKTSTLSADADKVLCDFMAEKEGFEPPEQLPVHRISSAARSTTPAFLLRFEHRKITTDFSSCQGSMSKKEETEWAREERICIVAKKKRESREKTKLPKGERVGEVHGFSAVLAEFSKRLAEISASTADFRGMRLCISGCDKGRFFSIREVLQSVCEVSRMVKQKTPPTAVCRWRSYEGWPGMGFQMMRTYFL